MCCECLKQLSKIFENLLKLKSHQKRFSIYCNAGSVLLHVSRDRKAVLKCGRHEVLEDLEEFRDNRPAKTQQACFLTIAKMTSAMRFLKARFEGFLD